MRQLKIFLVAVLALMVGLSSCSNDKQDEPAKADKSLQLKLITKATDGTRSITDPVADETEVTFTSGMLYCVSSADLITKYYTIGTDGDIKLSELTSTDGKTLTNVPGHTSKVMIVGNVDGLPTSGSITAIKGELLGVNSQTDSEGGITAAALFDKQPLVNPTAEGKPYTASLDLKPTISRIEISDITGSGNITSFKVDGIFINNFYIKAPISGDHDTEHLTNYGSDVNKYPHDEFPKSLYDYKTAAPGIGSLDGLKFAPEAGKVWAYNMFAGSPVPHIIIRLSAVTAKDIVFTGDQYITIRTYTNTETDKAVKTFEPGKNYKIGAGIFTFDEDDLTPEPESKTKDVEVKVTLLTWKDVNVKPGL